MIEFKMQLFFTKIYRRFSLRVFEFSIRSQLISRNILRKLYYSWYYIFDSVLLQGENFTVMSVRKTNSRIIYYECVLSILL